MELGVSLTRRFEELFGKTPQLFRAPGRVNLIGEHTDYNDGFVMPAAINLYCWVAIAPRSDRSLLFHSNNFSQSISVSLDEPRPARRNQWTDYVVGTALALEQSGYRLKGADVLVSGEIPLGSGLSSSAAIEVATGYALLKNSNEDIDLVRLALACRRAENEFVGAHVGIMDQFISAHGQAGQALMLDCRSLEFKLLPIPSTVHLVVCNTGVRHAIATGEYNQRRAQLEEQKGSLPELIYRRCHHIVTENARVQAAAEALRAGDLGKFGDLMGESHGSLRDDFEVSCPELDTAVEIADALPGIIGARMTGGGFGGCTINLVRADESKEFGVALAAGYQQRTGIHPEIYILSAADGVHSVTSKM
jgi:galactokinase